MIFLPAPNIRLLTAGLSVLLFCFGALAQETQEPQSIESFTLEATLPLTNIGVSGDINVPPNVLASIQGGALEIRQMVEALPNNRVRVRHFLVPPGSPNPTPAAAMTSMVEDYTATIQDTVWSSDPRTITWIGTVQQSSIPSPFGQTRGLPFIYSVGYDTTETPASFNSITLVIPGRVTTYAASSTGTLTFEGDDDGEEPGEPGENEEPVADAGENRAVVQTEVLLDATGSTDPDGDELTYSWHVVRGSANLIDADTATPRVQLSGNYGEYVFEVTVTDESGASSTAQVTITYSGRF